ncbi:alpha/beta fold hydrolase [Aliiglaciecola sp. LCG003]|uniref:esterase/lipase family protein n=1 Tax=Aliiglaciecola sp. LCG003 TaxID=3053655 RepID=UPI00257233DA|nr:alpha/beta fold hydrolase [Aliiglaciecola sp. LCG003]WJG08786.1 hypothetical protein QR722_15795 [Aliiglaciecola sp. LCG003]
MQILFVHGMGRSPISGTPLLWRLRRHGHSVDVVSYFAGVECFNSIVKRVQNKITDLSERGQYVLVGHSLGGVILRAALQKLGDMDNPPQHLFLLGSPVFPARLARKSQNDLSYKLLAGDSGQLLASKKRLGSIEMPNTPTTAIVGTKDVALTKRYFQDEENDGVVAIGEVTHSGIEEIISLPVIHTFLPSSHKVCSIIIDKISHLQSQLAVIN